MLTENSSTGLVNQILTFDLIIPSGPSYRESGFLLFHGFFTRRLLRNLLFKVLIRQHVPRSRITLSLHLMLNFIEAIVFLSRIPLIKQFS